MLAVQKKGILSIIRRHGFATREFSVEETQSLDGWALTVRFREGEQEFKAAEFPEKKNTFFAHWTRSALGDPGVARNLDDLSPLCGASELYEEFDHWLAHEVKPHAAAGTAIASVSRAQHANREGASRGSRL